MVLPLGPLRVRLNGGLAEGQQDLGIGAVPFPVHQQAPAALARFHPRDAACLPGYRQPVLRQKLGQTRLEVTAQLGTRGEGIGRGPLVQPVREAAEAREGRRVNRDVADGDVQQTKGAFVGAEIRPRAGKGIRVEQVHRQRRSVARLLGQSLERAKAPRPDAHHRDLPVLPFHAALPPCPGRAGQGDRAALRSSGI